MIELIELTALNGSDMLINLAHIVAVYHHEPETGEINLEDCTVVLLDQSQPNLYQTTIYVRETPAEIKVRIGQC